MKVILKENVQNLGQKNEIKEVADGYARNYLFPNNLAKKATESEVKKAKMLQEKREKAKEKKREKLEKMANEIEGKKVEFTMKTGEKGQLFESVHKKDIVEKIKELGYKEVEEKHINLENPIEKEGEYEVNLNLGENLSSKIEVIVKGEDNE